MVKIRLTSNKKFLIGGFLNRLLLYAPMFVIYFKSQGLDLPSIYKLLSYFSIMIAVLEYPTGVIGDYLGHKISFILGIVSRIVGYILIIFVHGFYIYILVITLFSLGMALESGSDLAILHKVSPDFKKDFASYKQLQLIAQMLSVFLGTVVYTLNSNLIWLISALFPFLTIILTISIKDVNTKSSEGNVLRLAIEGLNVVRGSWFVISSILVLSFIRVYHSNIKFVLNSLVDNKLFSLHWLSLLVGIEVILYMFGMQFSKKLKFINLQRWLSFVLSLFILAVLSKNLGYISIVIFILSAFPLGVIVVQVMHQLNKKINDNIRASVLSFSNLISRLTNSLFLLLIGYVLGLASWEGLLFVYVLISILILILVIYVGQLKKTTKLVNDLWYNKYNN